MRPNRRKLGSFACAALVVASLAATAQAPQQVNSPAETAVALNTESCPTVPPLSLVSLDWNPGFEHESAVAGINHFGLVFARVAADGVTVLSHPNGAYPRYIARSVSATPTSNGYYHLEFRFSKTPPPGLYRVVDAGVSSHVRPEYRGPAPQMIVSPARDRLCITVVGSPRSLARP